MSRQPGTVAKKAFYQAVFGDHPYAIPSDGTQASLAAITRDQVVEFHQRYYVARNALIAIVGAVSRAQAEQLAERLTAGLAAGEPAAELPQVAPLQQMQQERLQFPSSQSHILMGQPGMHRGDPDYFVLYVGNHILGGSGLVSQLSEEVREKRGLSYSVYSYFSPLRRNGPFLVGAQTQNSKAQEAIDVMLATLQQIHRAGADRGRADRGKAEYHRWFSAAYRQQRQDRGVSGDDRLLRTSAGLSRCVRRSCQCGHPGTDTRCFSAPPESGSFRHGSGGKWENRATGRVAPHLLRYTNQIRIIGGEYRGRKLSFPSIEGLRPTSDRVRETLFNWLQPILPGASCLDLFAGSGALGLEAASRGARRVVMLERSPKVVTQIAENISLLGAEEVEIHCADALQWLTGSSRRFDIVFLDPPFADDLLQESCRLLDQGGWLGSNARIYLETDEAKALPELPENWTQLRRKKAGQVCYYLFSC